MRDIHEWLEEDLELLVKANEKENLSIDYKDSRALNFSDKTKLKEGGILGDKHRADLIRDVAAMANAEGGKVIYGISERTGGYPKEVDEGTELKVTNADRIEQILLNNIYPRLEGFFIRPVELKTKGNDRYAYAILIPKASKNAPHQSDDKIYYKRHDATKLRMDDNEVRDMIGRSLEFNKKYGIAWDLLIEIRRLIAAATQRSKIAGGVHLARSTLSIAVSESLRTSGLAIMSMPRSMRAAAAQLVNKIDEYNSVVETADPGNRGEARLTDALRGLLEEIMQLGDFICGGLLKVLDDEPE